MTTTLCHCGKPAKKLIIRTSQRTGAEVSREPLCDEHIQAEINLGASNLSMTDFTLRDLDDAPPQAQPDSEESGERPAAQPLTSAEREVLEKFVAYTVSMRDAAARADADDQWQRYAAAGTVAEEVIANGWDDA